MIGYNSGYNLRLGKKTDSAYNFYHLQFDGKMSDVRLYDIVLTAEEIGDNMYDAPSENEEGLVGSWNLGDCSGTTASDASASENDGTIYNAGWYEGGESTTFTAQLDPGKAYIQGHEFRTLISSNVEVERAREFAQLTDFERLIQYGNYAKVDNLTGFFRVEDHGGKAGGSATISQRVDIHNSAPNLSNPGTYDGTLIGSCRVREITPIDRPTVGTPATWRYQLFIYDIQMTGELIPDSIMSIYEPGEKMEKQQYKEILADSIEESNRKALLAAEYIDKLNHIWNIVKDTPNDIELGGKIRRLHNEKDKKSRT